MTTRRTPWNAAAERSAVTPWREESPGVYTRGIEPSRGYLRLAYNADRYCVTVYCENYEIALPWSPVVRVKTLSAAKREAGRLLKRMRSALKGVGEDDCPF